MLTKLEHTGFNTTEGGNLHIVDGISPGDVRIGTYGIGLGPLRLTSWANSTVVVNGLTFSRAEPSSWWPLAAGMVGAATIHEREEVAIDAADLRMTRRAYIVGLGVTALAVGSAAAQEDEDRFNVATFQLDSNPRGLNVAVDDVVADYLDPGHTFYLSVDGGSLGRFEAGGSRTINPGVEGEVQLESDDALSFIDELIARVQADDEVEYEFRASDESFATLEAGKEVVLSSQPVLVDPLAAAEPGEVLVKINGTTIPHADDGGDAAGEWYVRDDTALVYVPGPDAPDSSLVNVRINVSVFDRLRERIAG